MTDNILNSEGSTAPVEAAPAVESTTSEATSFLDNIAEDIRGEASLKDFKDVNGLAKSYVNSQRMLGNSVRIPGEDASVEAKAEFMEKIKSVQGIMEAPNLDDAESMGKFYNQLGRPEEAKGYKAELPENLEINSDQLDGFNGKMHELGLTQGQYKGVLEMYTAEKAAEVEYQTELAESNLSQIKEIWGNDFNNRAEAAKTVLNSFKEKYPEAVAQLVDGANGNNPVLLSLLADAANMYQEKGAIGGQTKHQFGMSAEEAREKYNEIIHNLDHDYYKGNKAAVERANKLLRIANGE
jgi:hypothetical protein